MTRLTYKRYGPLNAQILNAHRKWEGKARDVIIDAIFYMGTDVKEKTPFLTGRAVAHWEVALNGRPGVYDRKKTEPRGMAIDVSNIEGYQFGDRIHLYNKAPYAIMLEEGWSSQAAPGQMLRAQAARFQEYLNRAAADNDL